MEREQLIKEIESLEPLKISDSKEVIKDKLAKQGKVFNSIVTMDAFQNEMARLGFGQDNLSEGAAYPLTRRSYNYTLFTSMYRSSWITRKIVDVFPSDMLKNWIKFTSDLEPDIQRKIDNTIRKTRLKSKLKEGLQWARLYGGAAGLILIEGDEDLSEPLDYDLIMPNSFKGLIIFDRWSGINPSLELEDDINDIEFGLPKYYNISTNVNDANVLTNKDTTKVHHSRIVRFEGRNLPYWEKQTEMFWGESELEIVMDELKKRDNTSANIASLIFLANIRVLKMADLGQILGANSELARQNLYNVISAQNHLMSNMGIYVMDKDDDFTTEQYTFSGLSEVYESFMLDVAGACEMPVTKLFGRNPAGFNATGESDLVQYYETVEEKQEEFLLPVIDKLLPVICVSAVGSVPEELDWEFNPCMSVNNKDLADLASAMAEPVFTAFSSGLIDKSTALKELKQQSDKTGLWSNITDEVIENAMNEMEDQDISEEAQKEIAEGIRPKPPKSPVDGQRDDLGINTQEQNENVIQLDSEPYRWRKRFMNLGG